MTVSEKCSEIISRWGKPSYKSFDGDLSTYTYMHDFVWLGVIPIVLVPIPLALPVGRRTTALTCRDDKVIRATGTESGIVFVLCGQITSQKAKFECNAGVE